MAAFRVGIRLRSHAVQIHARVFFSACTTPAQIMQKRRQVLATGFDPHMGMADTSTTSAEMNGLREFLREGLRMHQFKHERVLNLIGISFDDHYSPLIVLPFMANGALLDHVRNANNWSYGVCVWELLTRGQQPFAEMTEWTEIYTHLHKGNRLPIPLLCPPIVYNNLMMRCWQWTAEDRPTFADICRDLPTTIRQLEQQDKYRNLIDMHYERPNPNESE
ncbi:unnamed protein product [Sphagnum balticum]